MATLHPAMKAAIEKAGRGPYRNLFDYPLSEALAEVRGNAPARASLPWDGRTEDHQVPSKGGQVAVRTYVARSRSHGVLMFFHGGGWVAGSVQASDAACQAIASTVGWTVVSVDYRLAPEHKFPIPFEDCYAATCWAAARDELFSGQRKLVVAGPSAGGNLAAAVVLAARDRRDVSIDGQILIYPVCDGRLDYPSFTENNAYLNRDRMAWYWAQYLASDQDRVSPYAAPGEARDFRGLPPALVVTAGLDPLRDEGLAYASKLQNAGVATKAVCYDGVIHGYFSMSLELPQSKETLVEMKTFLDGLKSA